MLMVPIRFTSVPPRSGKIVIKQALNKLVVSDEFPAVLAAESFQDLAVTAEHAFAVGQLPQLHRDPFDRILIAQCVVENLTLVSADVNVRRYPIPVIDA